jgi:hypothetical protein
MVRFHLPAKYYYKSITEQPTEINTRQKILILESYLLKADSRESSTLIHDHPHHQGANTRGSTSGCSDKGFTPTFYMNEHWSQQKNIEILEGLLM